MLSAPMKQYIHRAVAVREVECEALRSARVEMCRHLEQVREEKRIAVKAANLDELLAQIESQKLIIAERDATIQELQQQNKLLAQTGGSLQAEGDKGENASTSDPTQQDQNAETLHLAIEMLEKNAELLEQRKNLQLEAIDKPKETPEEGEANGSPNSSPKRLWDNQHFPEEALKAENEALRAQVAEHEATVKDRDTKIKEQNKVIKQMQTHLDEIIHSSRKLLTAQSNHRVRSPGGNGKRVEGGYVSPIFLKGARSRAGSDISSPTEESSAGEHDPGSPSRKTMAQHKEEMAHVGQHVERQVNMAVARKQAREVVGEHTFLSEQIDQLCESHPNTPNKATSDGATPGSFDPLLKAQQ